MRRIFARRITNSYQCDPDTVIVSNNRQFEFGDLIKYELPNGKTKVGYYVCECDRADTEPSVLVSVYKEMLL